MVGTPESHVGFIKRLRARRSERRALPAQTSTDPLCQWPDRARMSAHVATNGKLERRTQSGVLPGSADSAGLRLLSYNIQCGIGTSGMHRYVTESWKHILPHSEQLGLLQSIAGVAGQYDLVGLQEADVGSLRTGYVNQAEYVARCAGFEHWHAQTNRRVSQIATSAVGALCRVPFTSICEARLPGRIPGRGALIVTLPGVSEDLTVVIVHLALGQRDRLAQLAALHERLPETGPVVLMGDFNCVARGPEFDYMRNRCGLTTASTDNRSTFPSWRPVRGIDHVLISSDLKVLHSSVLEHTYSDHRPVSVTLDWQLASSVVDDQGADLVAAA